MERKSSKEYWRKVQVTKAAFKGLHRFVFFTEYYDERNYVLKCEFDLCH